MSFRLYCKSLVISKSLMVYSSHLSHESPCVSLTMGDKQLVTFSLFEAFKVE